jgi:hypothetical protein
MDMYDIIIISILFLIIGFIIYVIAFIGKQLTAELKQKRELEEVILYSNVFNNSNDIYVALDSIINEHINEYKIFHPDEFEKSIISSDQQIKLIKEISTDIITDMSPAFFSQLSLIFNPKKENIHKMITTRVTLAIISLVAGNNNYNYYDDNEE